MTKDEIEQWLLEDIGLSDVARRVRWAREPAIDATGRAEAAFAPDVVNVVDEFTENLWEKRANEIMQEGDFSHNAFIQQAIARNG